MSTTPNANTVGKSPDHPSIPQRTPAQVIHGRAQGRPSKGGAGGTYGIWPRYHLLARALFAGVFAVVAIYTALRVRADIETFDQDVRRDHRIVRLTAGGLLARSASSTHSLSGDKCDGQLIENSGVYDELPCRGIHIHGGERVGGRRLRDDPRACAEIRREWKGSRFSFLGRYRLGSGPSSDFEGHAAFLAYSSPLRLVARLPRRGLWRRREPLARPQADARRPDGGCRRRCWSRWSGRR